MRINCPKGILYWIKIVSHEREDLPMNDTFLLRAGSALLAIGMLPGIMVSATAADAPFTLTSPDIANGKTLSEAQVFNSFGCSGRNVSPALAWSNAPSGTNVKANSLGEAQILGMYGR